MYRELFITLPALRGRTFWLACLSKLEFLYWRYVSKVTCTAYKVTLVCLNYRLVNELFQIHTILSVSYSKYDCKICFTFIAASLFFIALFTAATVIWIPSLPLVKLWPIFFLSVPLVINLALISVVLGHWQLCPQGHYTNVYLHVHIL